MTITNNRIGRLLKWALVLTGLSAAASGCCRTGGPAVQISVPVVDVHSHLFNARDLPLAGIMNALGVPQDVAESLAAVLNWWTPQDDGGSRGPAGGAGTMPVAATDDLGQVTASIRANRAARGRAARESLLAPLTDAQRARLLDYAGAARVTRSAGGRGPASPDEAEVEAVARALARAQFPPGDTHAVGPQASRGLADLGGYLRFLGVITRSHAGIARQMSDQQYPQVRLFVHHMMDMAATYADAPAVPFDRQWEAMTRLDAAAGGKLVHFVAFDPFRRADALDYVKRGLAAGAIGVKFYPPSGYSAAGNVVECQPPVDSGDGGAARRWQSRYGGAHPLDGKAIDDLNDALFQFCVDQDVPVFTHCTTTGFEAAKGYGLKSDPKYWAVALEQHPTLRLCFGHAGGDQYWFPQSPTAPAATAPTAGEPAFGAEVVRLCLKHPNVYCEAGYLEEILDPQRSGAFRTRLASIIDSKSDDGTWRFGDKFMYGTDWFMIAKERHPESYLADFWKVFNEDARLK